MAERLFPVAPTPLVNRTNQPPPPPGSQVGKDWEFDFEKGDFVIDRDGNVPKIEGHRVPAQQVVCTALVDRSFHHQFRRSHGINYEYAQQRRHREQVYASLEKQIRDRMTRIRGVKEVIDFQFRAGPFDVYYPPRYVTLPPVPWGGRYRDMEAWSPPQRMGYYDALSTQTYAQLEEEHLIPGRTVVASGGLVHVPADAIGIRFVCVLDVGIRYRFGVTSFRAPPNQGPIEPPGDEGWESRAGRYWHMEQMDSYLQIATNRYQDLEPPRGQP